MLLTAVIISFRYPQKLSMYRTNLKWDLLLSALLFDRLLGYFHRQSVDIKGSAIFWIVNISDVPTIL